MVLACAAITAEAFRRFGRYVNIYEAVGEDAPLNYTADVLAVTLNSPVAGIGACATGPCKPVMRQMERHAHTEEGWIVFDGDCVAAFGEPCANANDARYAAFAIPKGTIMTILPGVWHYAPFAAGDRFVRVAAVLPPHTPENDLEVQPLAEELIIAG